jgi:hypothetical protein
MRGKKKVFARTLEVAKNYQCIGSLFILSVNIATYSLLVCFNLR